MSDFGSGSFGSFDASAHLGDALSALVDGELAPAQEAAAQAHLAGCPSCAHELLAVTQARSWVRALPPVDPPFGLFERMLLERPQPVPGAFGTGASLRRRAGLAAVGAAAAAVMVLGVGSPSQPPVSPAVPRMVEAHATGASIGADLVSKLVPVGVPVTFGR